MLEELKEKCFKANLISLSTTSCLFGMGNVSGNRPRERSGCHKTIRRRLRHHEG